MKLEKQCNLVFFVLYANVPGFLGFSFELVQFVADHRGLEGSMAGLEGFCSCGKIFCNVFGISGSTSVHDEQW